MSLRSKVALTLTIIVVTFAVFDNVLQRVLVRSKLTPIELEEAKQDLSRMIAQVDAATEEVGTLAREWSRWGENLRRGAQHSEQFDPNAATAQAQAADVDVAFLCDSDLSVVWARAINPETGALLQNTAGPLRIPREALSKFHPLVPSQGEQVSRQGLWDSSFGPLVISTHWIPVAPKTHTAGDETLGLVVVGRYLDTAALAAGALRGQAQVHIWHLDDPALPEAEFALRDTVSGSSAPLALEQSSSQIQVYGLVRDVQTRPMFMLRADLERALTLSALSAVDFSLLSGIASTLLVVLVLMVMLQALVVRPLSRLTRFAVDVGHSDDTTARIKMERKDEVGTLAGEFDSMLAKLALSRSELVDTARLAGMSEIATGILHNVGNVMNSVNVSVDVIRGAVGDLPGEDLSRLLEIVDGSGGDLAKFVTEDPRAPHILPLLREIAESFRGGRRSLLDEIRMLDENIEHTVVLVRSQQEFAGKGCATERVDLVHQVEAAVRVATQASKAETPIEIRTEFAELPTVFLDRHRLMDVIINLVQNARQAIEECGQQAGCITIRTLQVGVDLIRIEVQDNGPGIEPESLERIFAHGFTTRKLGHGFGLHSSANAAVEMGGRLYAESGGKGTGAKFLFEIPLEVERRAQAA